MKELREGQGRLIVSSILFKFKLVEQKMKFSIKDFPFCAVILASMDNKEAYGDQMIAERKPFDKILGFQENTSSKGV